MRSRKICLGTHGEILLEHEAPNQAGTKKDNVDLAGPGLGECVPHQHREDDPRVSPLYLQTGGAGER